MASSLKRIGNQELPGQERNSLRRFLDWWRRELFQSLPRPVQLCLGARQAELSLELSGRRVRLSRRSGSHWKTLIETKNEGGNPEFRLRLSDFVRNNGLAGAEVDLLLEPRHFLRRIVELPETALENLREVLGFEMDRYTPMDASAVHYDFRVIERDHQRKRIKVDLVVLPRSLAEEAAAYGRELGLTPFRLGLAERERQSGATFNLLPASLENGGGKLWRYSVAGLAAVLVLLASAAVYLPLHHKRANLEALEARVADARIEAQQVAELKRMAEELLARDKALEQVLRQRITATELLEEVSLRLPDDTWVERLVFREQEILIAGFSKRPSALIGLLGQSPILSDVTFRGAVKPDPRLKLDTFRLSADVERQGAAP